MDINIVVFIICKYLWFAFCRTLLCPERAPGALGLGDAACGCITLYYVTPYYIIFYDITLYYITHGYTYMYI